MENSTISMAMFNSYVSHNQKGISVCPIKFHQNIMVPSFSYGFPMVLINDQRLPPTCDLFPQEQMLHIAPLESEESPKARS